jgi:hypothetical protein
MDTQQRLEHVAERYREQGYQVILNPSADDLPSFAKDFKVEILASRPDGKVLASAKASSSEFEKDKNLSRYAEIIENQRGWRYDVFVLGPPAAVPDLPDISDATEVQIEQMLSVADQLSQAGFGPQAVVASSAALESAMRHRLRSIGEKADWGASPRSMLNELVSSGILTHGEFRDLEEVSRLRNMIVHGFAIPEISPDAVPSLARTARRLLVESKQAEPVS